MSTAMRRSPFGRLLLAAAAIALVLGTATLAEAAAAGPDTPMVIPVGPDGVTYRPPQGEGDRWWGPTAMAVAPDGSVWIADVFGHRLVHYAADGSPLPPVDLEDSGAWRIISLDVDEEQVVGLEVNPTEGITRVHRVSHAGAFLASYDVPDGYRLEDGLTGVWIADDGALVLELEGGQRLVQIVDAAGREEVVPLDGRVREGRRYATTRIDSQHVVVTAGDVEVDITSEHFLGLVLFIGVAPDGGFQVVVEEVDFDTDRVEQTFHRYRADGELVARARRDLSGQLYYVENGLDVGADGEVYTLAAYDDHMVLERATFEPDSSPPPDDRVRRWAGANRFATAATVAGELWGPDTGTAVVATGADFPDALAAGAVAARHDAPLLLDGPGLLDELRRLGVTEVVVAGGPAAVPDTTLDAIRALPARPQVRRVSGPDRFATASALALEAGAPEGAAAVASGLGFADAVAAGALLATPARPPVVLTLPGQLPASSGDALAALGVRTAHLLGGTVAVGDDVEAALRARGIGSQRLAGTTRYDTSTAVLTRALADLPEEPRPLVVATGDDFPDALAAGAASARLDGTLLLVPRAGLTGDQLELLRQHRHRFTGAIVIGGTAAVSNAVEQQLRDVLAP